jgi:iron complex outermembrane receptor protein
LIYIPSYTVLDATASYDFRYLDPKLDGWQAQINATNLEDEYYVASCQSGLAYCGLGAGRTVLGTLKYSWK